MKNELAKVAPPADRVHEVFGWVLSGASEYEVTEAIAKTWPDAEPRPLIVAAVARIAESGEADTGILKGWCIEATRRVYQQALAAADFSAALRALKQIHQFSR